MLTQGFSFVRLPTQGMMYLLVYRVDGLYLYLLHTKM
jgi:hypothetical protein